METKICPNCGSQIDAAATQCVYCGQLVSMPYANMSEQMAVGQSQPVQAPNYHGQYDQMAHQQQAQMQQPIMGQNGYPAQQQYPPQYAMPQPIQVNVNVQQSQAQEQTQMQYVYEESVPAKESSQQGALWGQVIIIAIVLGLVTKSWWVFLGALFGLAILLVIPIIGAAVCVLLALFDGWVAGLLAAAFFSPAAGWVIGIIVALAMAAVNLRGRKEVQEQD